MESSKQCDHGSDNVRDITINRYLRIVGIDRSEDESIGVNCCNTLYDVTIVAKSRDNHVIFGRACIQLDENHITRAEKRRHAVAGHLQSDVAPERNSIGKFEPLIARLIPQHSSLAGSD